MIFLILWVLEVVHVWSITTTVTTDKGVIQGFMTGNLIHFLGVPYAQPPLGNLRWQPPFAHDPWKSPLMTTDFSAACIQNPTAQFTFPANVTFSEDCLYLNIWVTNSTKPNKSVLVWIHGGGYTQGGNSEIRLLGEYMSRSADVIVININYRLGIFGWLGHSAFAKDNDQHPTTGNYGFLDQVMALTWVQKNIAAFGGDPTHVTIMGESAGGTSVCLHLVSPVSKGLYSKAIVESGACYTETAFLTTVTQQAARVQQYLNCSGSVAQVASCLRSITAANLLSAFNNINFKPMAVVDGLVFTQHPFLSISNKQVNQVPLLSGNVLNEGTIFVRNLARPLSVAAYEQELTKLFAVVKPLVLEQYPCNSTDCWPVIADVVGDYYLVCPTEQLANALASPTTTTNWAYVFTHTPAWSVPIIPGYGAFHSSEVPFVFSTLGMAYSATPAETTLSNQMTRYWTNFAISGNPNGPATPPLSWYPYTTFNGNRIVLDTTLTNEFAWKSQQCQFWNTVYLLLYTSPI